MFDLFTIASLICVFLLVLVVSLNALGHGAPFTGTSRVCISICVAFLSVIGIAQDVNGFLIPAATLGITIPIVLLLSVLFRLFDRGNVPQDKPEDEVKPPTPRNRLARTTYNQKPERRKDIKR